MDEKDDGDAVTEEGCARILESTLINGLNSTNLLLLTGAGSSFCIKNAAGSKVTSKTAPRTSGFVECRDGQGW